MLEGLRFAGLLMKGFGWQWVRAVISTLRYLPQLYRQRVKFQSQRVRSDREFLQPGPVTVDHGIYVASTRSCAPFAL